MAYCEPDLIIQSSTMLMQCKSELWTFSTLLGDHNNGIHCTICSQSICSKNKIPFIDTLYPSVCDHPSYTCGSVNTHDAARHQSSLSSIPGPAQGLSFIPHAHRNVAIFIAFLLLIICDTAKYQSSVTSGLPGPALRNCWTMLSSHLHHANLNVVILHCTHAWQGLKRCF